MLYFVFLKLDEFSLNKCKNNFKFLIEFVLPFIKSANLKNNFLDQVVQLVCVRYPPLIPQLNLDQLNHQHHLHVVKFLQVQIFYFEELSELSEHFSCESMDHGLISILCRLVDKFISSSISRDGQWSYPTGV